MTIVLNFVIQEVTYRFISSNDDGMDLFLLEERTGIIRLKRPLNNPRSRYIVTIYYSLRTLIMYHI